MLKKLGATSVKIHSKLEGFIPKLLKAGGYEPHMTVGKIEDEIKFKKAIEETGEVSDSFNTFINMVSVEIIDENEDSIIEMEIKLED